MNSNQITIQTAKKLIQEQFPEFSHLPITEVEKQGHDNRTYRLGDDILIRMPTADEYALKVSIEQELLPKLAPFLSISIPAPIKMGKPSNDYSYPFSIYKWLPGKSLNLINLSTKEKEILAFDLARFLQELHAIKNVAGLVPGQHNWWRGDHISVYDKNVREQIAKLAGIIDDEKVMNLWERACNTKWNNNPVWVHGDFASGNILIQEGKLSAVIDFGSTATGDPACDLVIAWTYFEGKAQEIFINAMNIDKDTWLRACAWALWKATFVLCNIENKDSVEAIKQKKIIEDVIN
ncbi:MAG: aminoglycoside phosphotransferase family protein [Sphingobacteriia bacterium]|nr:aminoglycoside phosphotransferase family protein [Sphingobacteriia bacterium]